MEKDNRTIGKMPLSCLLKLQSHYNSLKSAERKAADFLKKNPSFVANSTIAESAKKAGCSEPTFVRLARRLGYAGFADMKKELNNANDEPVQRVEVDTQGERQPADVVKSVFELTIQTLKDTIEILDYEKYEQALDVLVRAKRIAFCGIGDAASVANAAYIKFLRIGYDVQCLSDPDTMLMNAANFGEGDVFVLISHSGNTKALVNVAKYLKNSPVKVIAITNYPSTPLVKNSDICIFTSAFVEELKGEVMANRVVGLCIIESLFTNIVTIDKSRYKYMEKCKEAVIVNKYK